MICNNCHREIGEASQCPYCQHHTLAEVQPHHIQPGTVINGRYVIKGVLGEGGFGITYLGHDNTLNTTIAIKEYFPYGFSHRTNTISNTVSVSAGDKKEAYDKGKTRFLKEARNLARFQNEPGIVHIFDFVEENNTAYIVMEYLDGIDLRKYLKDNGTFTTDQILSLMMPVMKSLDKVHQAGIIHRDISPDNLMYLRDGTLKLMDFGAARDFDGDGRSMSVMLKQGYAPEEQYRRNGEQGPWTDVYGICATMYRCITGRIPMDSLDRNHEDHLQRPSQLGVSISPAVENVLMYGLAVKSNERCQSMSELIGRFQEAQKAPNAPGYGAPLYRAQVPGANANPAQQTNPYMNNAAPGGFTPPAYAQNTGFPAGQNTTVQPGAPTSYPSQATPYPGNQQNAPQKKSPKKPLIIAGAVALAVVITVLAIVIPLSSQSPEKRLPRPTASSSTESSKSNISSASSQKDSDEENAVSDSFSTGKSDKAAKRLEKTVNYYIDHYDMSGYVYDTGMMDNGLYSCDEDDQSWYNTYMINHNGVTLNYDEKIEVDDLTVTLGKTTLGDMMDKGCKYYSDTYIPKANYTGYQIVDLKYDGKDFTTFIDDTGSDVEKAVITDIWTDGSKDPLLFGDPIDFDFHGIGKDADMDDVIKTLGAPRNIEFSAYDIDYSDNGEYGSIEMTYDFNNADLGLAIEFTYDTESDKAPVLAEFRFTIYI